MLVFEGVFLGEDCRVILAKVIDLGDENENHLLSCCCPLLDHARICAANQSERFWWIDF